MLRNKTTFCDVQENMNDKVHEHTDFTVPNVCDSQTSSRKFVGVSKTATGYRARIWNPMTGMKQTLGIFKSAEEASMVYLAKKAEFGKQLNGKRASGLHVDSRKFVGVSKAGTRYGATITNPVTRKRQRLGTFKSAEEASMARLTKIKELEKIMNDKKEIQGVVCDEGIKKNQKSRIPKRKKYWKMNENKMVGVRKTKNGKYSAKIKHGKKEFWLGTFRSAEEASMAYLTMKRDLEKEVKGKKGIQLIKKVVDQLDQCLGNSVSEPSLENKDSCLQVDSRNVVLGKKLVRVNRMKSGEYYARIIHPITKKEISLGSFGSHEEAAMVYLAKKTEFEKEFAGTEEMECAGSKDNEMGENTDRCPILEENNHEPCSDNQRIKKVVDQLDQCFENKDSSLQVDSGKVVLCKKMVGVNKMKSGKYNARIIHPITKKRIWLGSFRSHEEAATMYFAKKTEFQKEFEGTEDKEIRKSTNLCPILEENNHEPCSDNQDSAMVMEPIDSLEGESAIKMENIMLIEKNGGSARIELSTDSIVWSEPGADILLRSESGEPIMDSHGFLLGNFSWIDDLSLPSLCFIDGLS